MQRLRRDDKVIVLTGKNKGQRGVILKVIEKNGDHYVLVEGVNIIKKHVKRNPQEEKPGGIIEKEAPIHISNVAILNPATDKADKIGFRILENKTKVRFFKSNGEVLDV